jgi:alpha-galactosidase
MLGDFYPLFAHDASEKNWYGYQFHRPDLDAGVAIVFRRERNPDPARTIRPAGVNARSRYAVAFEGAGEQTVLMGKALRALKVEIPEAPGSAVVYYRKENGGCPVHS